MEPENKPLLSHHHRIKRSIIPPKLRAVWRKDYFPCLPARYVLAIMSCLGFVIVYALRVNLSVAIVEMDNSTATVHHSARVFDWSSSQTGWILSSFFYGYIITQIPGGWLATRFGGKWVFGIGIVMTAVFTLLTPLAANHSVWLLVSVRVLEGFFEGVTFPAMHAIWGRWAPSPERSKLTTITYSGPSIGNIISFPLSAVLCQYGFDGGWPSVFYIFGALGIIWFILWILTASNSPSTHPRISPKEREYIESHLPPPQQELDIPWWPILTSPAAWAIIVANFCANWGFYTLLTCMPTYFEQALNLTLGGSSESIVMNGIFSAIPYTLFAIVVVLGGRSQANDVFSYMMESHSDSFRSIVMNGIFFAIPYTLFAIVVVLGGRSQANDVFSYMMESHSDSFRSIVMNGVFSAIPYTLFAIMVVLGGQTADFLRAKQLSTTIVRKGLTIAGFLFAATFLLLCGYFGTNTATAVTFLTLGVGLSALSQAGFNINHLDIAPRYAGILMGLANTAGTIPGIAGPQIAKLIAVTPHAPKGSAAYYHKFRDEWREVFFISAEIYIFGAIIYLILGSGNKQPWADGSASKTRQRSTVAANMEVSGTNDISEKEYLINCARVDIQQQHEDIDT